jgi:predicted Zn-dependent peptidase
MRHIASLTPQDLQQVARDIFDPEHITTLIYE